MIELIYPRICLGCGQGLRNRPHIAGVVCVSCWEKIKRNRPPFCHSCGRTLQKTELTKNICRTCVRNRMHFDRAFSPCAYENLMKTLIHEFKYRGREYLAEPLANLMIEFIRSYRLPINDLHALIPVPLSAARMREREFNQAELLSQRIATAFQKELITGALVRSRHTPSQTDLSPDQRLTNVRNSFTVTDPDQLYGKNLLLVDDVLTTGATSSEAARALKDAGAHLVFVLTVAN